MYPLLWVPAAQGVKSPRQHLTVTGLKLNWDLTAPRDHTEEGEIVSA